MPSMSDSRPPGPPPAGPAVPPPPPGPPAPRSGSRLGWYVAGAALVLVVAIGGAVFAFTGGDATSVQEVADQAVEAAEDLDIDAGIDLLCTAPSEQQRQELESLIAEGREETGDDDPDIDYEISEVEGDEEGSFRVTATSDDPALEGKELDAVVIVDEVDGRSCISTLEDTD